MTVAVITFPNGRWRENCYLFRSSFGEMLIIDPGSEADEIKNLIRKQESKPLAILLTHGHYDHIGAASSLSSEFNIPIYLHGDDLPLLRRANLYRLVFEANESIEIPKITHDLRDMPELLSIPPFSIQWISTPGHTPGSVCYIIDQEIVTGDTVLTKGIVDMRLPGSSKEVLKLTLKKMTTILPGNLTNRPGHGKPTSIHEALTASMAFWCSK